MKEFKFQAREENRPGTSRAVASSNAARTESSHQRGCVRFHIDRTLRPQTGHFLGFNVLTSCEKKNDEINQGIDTNFISNKTYPAKPLSLLTAHTRILYLLIWQNYIKLNPLVFKGRK